MHEIEKKTRSYLESNCNYIHLPFINSFPDNCCELSSIILCKVLITLDSDKDMFLMAGYDREEDESHYWIINDNSIIDITADQFDNIKEPLYGEQNNFIINKFKSVEKIPVASVFSNNDLYINNEAEITNLSNKIISS